MTRIERTKQSDEDLEDIGLFVALDNPPKGYTFVDEIVKTYEIIASMPRMGRERRELGRGVRSHPFGQYIIFYQIQGIGIEILRVLHGARDIPSLFQDTN